MSADEQRAAIAAEGGLVLIEACAGAGKTRVLVERFGRLRWGGRPSGKGVLVLGYSSATVGEARSRILKGYGPKALSWPSGCMTVDELFRHLFSVACSAGLLGNELNVSTQPVAVHDTWQGHDRAFRTDGKPANWYQHARIGTYRRREPALRFDRSRLDGTWDVRDKRERLLEGVWTHRDVRDVVLSAINRQAVRAALTEYLASRFDNALFDECFDGNREDLNLMDLLREGAVAVTMVGDSWQAIYEFRESRPADVHAWIAHRKTEDAVVETPLKISRRQTGELLSRSQYLRGDSDRYPGVLASIPGDVRAAHSRPDVVLGRRWKDLRRRGVLPTQLGRAVTCPPAVVELAYRQLIVRPGSGTSVQDLLPRIAKTGAVLESVPPITHLLGGDLLSYPDFLTAARDYLWHADIPVKDFRRSWEMTERLLKDRSAEYLEELTNRLAFAREIAQEPTSPPRVPGQSIHAAKGREWDHVCLVQDETFAQLLSGVGVPDIENEDHRILYVACSRARRTLSLLTIADSDGCAAPRATSSPPVAPGARPALTQES